MDTGTSVTATRGSGEPLRVVFYSHDSQGLGHFRRNRALAHTLAQRIPVLTGSLVTGLLLNGVSGAAARSLPRGFDVVTLPGIGKSAERRGYGPRHLDLGMDAVLSVRGEIVRATGLAFRPDLVVVDRHALGVGGELLAGLHAMRRELPQTRFVLGLRDVLDTPEAVASEWRSTPSDLVAELYDEIWIYGDPGVHDLRASGELPAELAPLVRYQGFLAHGRAEEPTHLEPEQPYLVTTAGGGSDGTRLCLAAAAAEVPAGHRHILITGPQMSDADHRAVEREAGRRTAVTRSVDDAAGLIRRSAASVSMAGYNTVAETLATDVPALLVPRERPRTEQLIRARALAAVGATDLLREDDLSPAAISRWWTRAVHRRVDRGSLDLGGLRAVASSAARLVRSSPALAPEGLSGREEGLSVAV
ncbi:glycosyltransferase family protein [Serinicoccus kebangsaanensis]|uniref:glycosyltransferase family protein n=1 Tax=Serinicoccus kebangsaanensis TaxID=2602069 RepID=UPI00124E3B5B|nr:glycosyltransferase [Serinicoccus kebangsaanensis]